MASDEAKKELENFLILEEKLRLFDIEETLELRKETSCLVLIGVSSERLGKAFGGYLSSVVGKAEVASEKTLTPLTDIVTSHKQNGHDRFYILDFSAEQYTDRELAEIVSNLNFYRDYIGELGLKVIVIASSETLQYIYSNAYDFVSFNNFMAYFDDVKIEIEMKVDFSKLEEAQRDYKEYIKQPQISTEIKMQKLHQLANIAYELASNKTAIKYYQDLLKLAVKKRNVFFEAASSGSLAGCFRDLGNYSHAIHYAKKAIALFKKINQKENEARVITSLARIYYLMKDEDTALEYLEKALFMINKLNVGDLKVDIFVNMGNVFMSKEIYGKATEYYKKALEIADGIKAERNISFAYNGIANIYAKQYSYLKAIEFYKKAIMNADAQSQAVYVMNIGNAYRFFGEAKKAIGYFEKTLEVLALTDGGNDIKAALFLNISFSYKMLGDLDKAMEYCEKANSVKQISQDGVSHILNAFGVIAFDSGETEKALGFYGQAMGVYKNTNLKIKTATTICNIGEAYVKLGDIAKAEPYLSQALEFSRQTADRLTEAYVLNEYGKMHGLKNEYDKAFEHYFLALDIAREIENPYIKCEILIEIGNLYILSKDTAKSKIYLAEASEIAQAGSFGLLLEKIKKVMPELEA